MIQLATVDHTQKLFSECFGISNEKAEDMFRMVIESIRRSDSKSQAFERVVRTYADDPLACCMATMMLGTAVAEMKNMGMVR